NLINTRSQPNMNPTLSILPDDEIFFCELSERVFTHTFTPFPRPLHLGKKAPQIIRKMTSKELNAHVSEISGVDLAHLFYLPTFIHFNAETGEILLFVLGLFGGHNALHFFQFIFTATVPY